MNSDLLQMLSPPGVQSVAQPRPQSDAQDTDGSNAFPAILQQTIQNNNPAATGSKLLSATAQGGDAAGLGLSVEDLAGSSDLQALLDSLDGLTNQELLQLAQLLTGTAGNKMSQDGGSLDTLQQLAADLLKQLNELGVALKGGRGLGADLGKQVLAAVRNALARMQQHMQLAHAMVQGGERGRQAGADALAPATTMVSEKNGAALSGEPLMVTHADVNAVGGVVAANEQDNSAAQTQAEQLTDGAAQSVQGKSLSSKSVSGAQEQQQGPVAQATLASVEMLKKLQGAALAQARQERHDAAQPTVVQQSPDVTPAAGEDAQTMSANADLNEQILQKIENIADARRVEGAGAGAQVELKQLKQLLQAHKAMADSAPLKMLAQQARLQFRMKALEGVSGSSSSQLKLPVVESLRQSEINLANEEADAEEEPTVKLALEASAQAPNKPILRLQQAYGLGQTKIFISPEVLPLSLGLPSDGGGSSTDAQDQQDDASAEGGVDEAAALAARQAEQSSSPSVQDANRASFHEHKMESLRTHGQDVVNRFLQSAKEGLRLWVQKSFVAMKVHLDPPELGRIEMKTAIEHGRVGVVLIAESEAARNLILSHVQDMKDMLKEQGLEVVGFNVELKHNAQGDAPGQRNQRKVTQKFDLRSLLEPQDSEPGFINKHSLFDKVA